MITPIDHDTKELKEDAEELANMLAGVRARLDQGTTPIRREMPFYALRRDDAANALSLAQHYLEVAIGHLNQITTPL